MGDITTEQVVIIIVFCCFICSKCIVKHLLWVS
jgi:hypothetical protein